ncbi:L,D-transpeptidase [Cyanobium sp. ATX 6F1]|uniref:L,D-transpeptidase n=1 Tax=unclassified Cyanobium TaxID=2627006 RepID=UPI0020CD715E|nr:L,D-transpeptidase [Cyanobium sp. ATX 6F1]MCP9915559.1 L,D-transpeptidase [Cyanobium sp. ATX 6F1]
MATPMTPERFQDRWEAFKDEPQQVSGVWGLYDAIKQADTGGVILSEQAPWALKFSEKPPAPPTPSGGLDPRGDEEAGLAGPKIAAPVKPGDSYLLVNDRDQDMEAYDHSGAFLWKVPCLARGQGADNDWKHTNTDTPPGLYRLGQLYPDYEQNPSPACSDTAMSYGWYSFDLMELENQEVKVFQEP